MLVVLDSSSEDEAAQHKTDYKIDKKVEINQTP